MSQQVSSRPLKCLFVITSMPVGGAETLLVNLMRRFDPQRILPEIVCLKEPGPLGESIASEFAVHHRLIGGKFDVRVLGRLAKLFRARRADAVITVGAGDKMFWGRLAAKLAGVPVIASALHSTGWPDGVGKLNRLLTPITDAFIAVADSHGRFLHEFEKFPESKVRVIRNGVDCERFRPDASARDDVRSELGLPSDAKIIGIVAALREEKNHGLLVRAAKALRSRHPGCHTLIIGEGPQRGSIESISASLGMTDRVHLLGNRHDTPRLLAAMDVFTLCSLNEASPVSILEALACQTPVVATDVGSISETVLPEQTGLLVPSGDETALAGALDRLLSDADLRIAMGSNGRQLVMQTGSLDAMVSGYERMVSEIHSWATKTAITV